MPTRILFLDDSGKPDVRHESKAVVIAGFAIDAARYSSFSRRILGAKKRHFPDRGVPQAWELKTTSVIKPNPWKRAKNRQFCDELARLIQSVDGTAFSVTIDKSRMKHPMTLSTTMPLQLQALVEHFGAECTALGRTGMVVADWSSHHLDQHASRCVASFAASRNLPVHPGMYYASSHGNEGIQVSDILAGIRRRTHEGDGNLSAIDARISAIRRTSGYGLTVTGRPFRNQIDLF